MRIKVHKIEALRVDSFLTGRTLFCQFMLKLCRERVNRVFNAGEVSSKSNWKSGASQTPLGGFCDVVHAWPGNKRIHMDSYSLRFGFLTLLQQSHQKNIRTSIVCASKAWYIWFLRVTDLHCSAKTTKNTPMSNDPVNTHYSTKCVLIRGWK